MREIVLELSELSKKNEQFIKLFIQSSEASDPEPVVEEAKNKIRLHFYGKSKYDIKLDLASARREVNEYSKILKEYPKYIAELKLYYVEVGNELTNEYGDIDERFYASVESMFDAFCKYVLKHPHLYDEFRPRIKTLYIECQNIGLGYSDCMSDLIYELWDAFETDPEV